MQVDSKQVGVVVIATISERQHIIERSVKLQSV